MTLNQTKQLVTGVLRGWFTNKTVLDKFTEDANGNVLYNGNAVSQTETVTDQDITNAITAVLADLNGTNNSDPEEPEEEPGE